MTRPDDIAEACRLAREIIRADAQNYDVEPLPGDFLGLARALLKLAPVWEAAQEWAHATETHDLVPAKRNWGRLVQSCNGLIDAITHARTGGDDV
jgi:hypothetical protein